MQALFNHETLKFFRKIVSVYIVLTFLTSLIVSPAGAQVLPVLNNPGSLVSSLATDGLGIPSDVTSSVTFQPPILLGLKIHPENPLLFDFIVDQGQAKLSTDELKEETTKLVKYFLAALTIPDKEVWVNLSPTEKDRIIPDVLGQTTMGKTMLEQDYVLKQLASSLTNPETELGKKYWANVGNRHACSLQNKVWIMPEKAEVLESNGIVLVGEKRLKVMLDEEYGAQILSSPHALSGDPLSKMDSRFRGNDKAGGNDMKELSTQVFRDLILPKIVEEVNSGKDFADVRQIYNSVILAAWYKKALKESLLGKIYADKGKVAGVETDDKAMKQRIYEQYLAAFKKGAYNLIKEEADENGDLIPRKYFSGGITSLGLNTAGTPIIEERQISTEQAENMLTAATPLVVQVYAATAVSEGETVSAAAQAQSQSAASAVVDQVIKSSPEYMTFHHRTDEASARSIVREGLRVGGFLLNLDSTASPSATDIQMARSQYEQRHRTNDTHVVIIALPRKFLLDIQAQLGVHYRDAREEFLEKLDSLAKKFNSPIGGGSILPTEFVRGYVNRATEEFVPNPKFNPNFYNDQILKLLGLNKLSKPFEIRSHEDFSLEISSGQSVGYDINGNRFQFVLSKDGKSATYQREPGGSVRQIRETELKEYILYEGLLSELRFIPFLNEGNLFIRNSMEKPLSIVAASSGVDENPRKNQAKIEMLNREIDRYIRIIKVGIGVGAFSLAAVFGGLIYSFNIDSTSSLTTTIDKVATRMVDQNYNVFSNNFKKLPKAEKGSPQWQEVQSLIRLALNDPIIKSNSDFQKSVEAFQRASQEQIYLISGQTFGFAAMEPTANHDSLKFYVGINLGAVKEFWARSSENPIYRQIAFGVFIKEGSTIFKEKEMKELFSTADLLTRPSWTDDEVKRLTAAFVLGESIGYKMMMRYLVEANPGIPEIHRYFLTAGKTNKDSHMGSMLISLSPFLFTTVSERFKNGDERELALRAVTFTMVASKLLPRPLIDRLNEIIKQETGSSESMNNLMGLEFFRDPKLLRPFSFFVDSKSSSGVTQINGDVGIQSSSVGGIDFDPTNMNLQIKRDGKGVPLPLPQQNLEQINIQGLFPVIINIMPINAETLPIFLGQAPKEPARDPELAASFAG